MSIIHSQQAHPTPLPNSKKESDPTWLPLFEIRRAGSAKAIPIAAVASLQEDVSIDGSDRTLITSLVASKPETMSVDIGIESGSAWKVLSQIPGEPERTSPVTLRPVTVPPASIPLQTSETLRRLSLQEVYASLLGSMSSRFSPSPAQSLDEPRMLPSQYKPSSLRFGETPRKSNGTFAKYRSDMLHSNFNQSGTSLLNLQEVAVHKPYYSEGPVAIEKYPNISFGSDGSSTEESSRAKAAEALDHIQVSPVADRPIVGKKAPRRRSITEGFPLGLMLSQQSAQPSNEPFERSTRFETAHNTPDQPVTNSRKTRDFHLGELSNLHKIRGSEHSSDSSGILLTPVSQIPSFENLLNPLRPKIHTKKSTSDPIETKSPQRGRSIAKPPAHEITESESARPISTSTPPAPEISLEIVEKIINPSTTTTKKRNKKVQIVSIPALSASHPSPDVVIEGPSDDESIPGRRDSSHVGKKYPKSPMTTFRFKEGEDEDVGVEAPRRQTPIVARRREKWLRKARRAVLRGPILKVLLGRELAKQTIPVLKMMAQGHDVDVECDCHVRLG